LQAIQIEQRLQRGLLRGVLGQRGVAERAATQRQQDGTMADEQHGEGAHVAAPRRPH